MARALMLKKKKKKVAAGWISRRNVPQLLAGSFRNMRNDKDCGADSPVHMSYRVGHGPTDPV